jgi:hypothetical protein
MSAPRRDEGSAHALEPLDESKQVPAGHAPASLVVPKWLQVSGAPLSRRELPLTRPPQILLAVWLVVGVALIGALLGLLWHSAQSSTAQCARAAPRPGRAADAAAEPPWRPRARRTRTARARPAWSPRPT